MNKRIVNKAISVFTGIVFIFSGVAKTADTSEVAILINDYGFGSMMVLAPVLVIAELILGINLLLFLWQRSTAFFGIILMFTLTSVYSYAWLENGITDCGCFGSMDILTKTPLPVYFRNGLLTGALIFIFFNSHDKSPAGWMVNPIIGLYSLSVFTPALTFDMDVLQAKEHKTKITKVSIPFWQSALSKGLSVSPDSSYFVFVFSYSCPHCLSSIDKIEDYHTISQRVIGLSRSDSAAKASFIEETGTNLEIIGTSPEVLREITTSVPLSFYIKNDSIRCLIRGELPDAGILKKEILVR
ncbi:MAG: DoxX family protein [Bacteroidota bacterium]